VKEGSGIGAEILKGISIGKMIRRVSGNVLITIPECVWS
jgi:hypothetical protein